MATGFGSIWGKPKYQPRGTMGSANSGYSNVPQGGTPTTPRYPPRATPAPPTPAPMGGAPATPRYAPRATPAQATAQSTAPMGGTPTTPRYAPRATPAQATAQSTAPLGGTPTTPRYAPRGGSAPASAPMAKRSASRFPGPDLNPDAWDPSPAPQPMQLERQEIPTAWGSYEPKEQAYVLNRPGTTTPLEGPSPTMSEADRAAAAAAAGAARSANASSAAAGRAGQTAEQANAAAVAAASNQAARGASAVPEPGLDSNPVTEHGRLYDEELLKILRGQDPMVQAAQRQADTNSSRRRYMARTTAQEAAAQAGAAPGTARYRRGMDREMAGANAASLEETQGVFDLSRARRNDALGASLGVEERTYGRQQTERTREDTQGLRDKQDVEAIINSVQDTRLKYHLRSVLAAGGDVRAEYVKALDNGTIRPEYRSESPVQNIKAEAEEWIDLVGPGVDANGNPLTREQAVVKRMQEIWATKNEPMKKAGEETTLDEIFGKLNLGQSISDTDRDMLIKSGRLVGVETLRDNGATSIGKHVLVGNGHVGKLTKVVDDALYGKMAVLDLDGLQVSYLFKDGRYRAWDSSKNKPVYFNSADEAIRFVQANA